MTGPPPDVAALAARRAEARAARDWAESDRLRDEIAAAGWLVRDLPGGAWELAPRPPWQPLGSVRDLPDRAGAPDDHPASVVVVVEGWPDDVRRCLASVLAHTRADVAVLVLDLGDVDGAGAVAHELAERHPDRLTAWHLAGPAGFAEARTALLRADTAAVHVWLDPSVELTGDAIGPLLAAFADESVGLAGGWGVTARPDWREFTDAPPGEVDALLGYLLAVRRSAALAAGPLDPALRFYRNADLFFSFHVRDAGWRAVATAPLPAVRHRHRGYHDSEPAYRDRESRRNYDRLLARFRGRDDLRIGASRT